MKTLGLTGGIGMGKSACDQLIRERGVPVIDTDLIAREIVEPGQPALEEITRLFGKEMLDDHGQLKRGDLARRVFAEEESRKQLEAVLHPRIQERWHKLVEDLGKEQKPLVVIVIPLLFETGADQQLDSTACVACSPKTQRVRLESRGWSIPQIEQRIAAQWSIDQKIAKADFVIWTEGPLAATASQIDLLLSNFIQVT